MTRALRLAALPLAALGAMRLAAQQAFTLEQVMSAPFPTDLVAAPAGGHVAWVFNAKGARNIWVADAPGYEAHAVTQYPDDDGQELGDLVWTADGAHIAYTRGGEANGRGEYPNPLSVTAGVTQAVWIVATKGGAGAPRELGEGHSPAPSPKGDRVAFERHGQIWIAGADSGAATQLFEARGRSGSIRWSPDGSKLAFVSDRGTHAFVGVYDFAAKVITWMAPSVDQDVEPVWSPDGARIAFIRIAAQPDLPYYFQRRAEPWRIEVADVATGAGHEAWRADTGDGSAFRETVAANQLLWAAGDRLVFPWEKDGWTHLYAVPAVGGRASLLTPGTFEVEDVALSPDRASVLINSNQDDIDRRHVWRVSVAGGTPVAVTRGSGLEWAPAPTADGAIALLRADGKNPPRPALIAAGKEPRDLAPQTIPSDFPAQALVVPQQVIFSGVDGMKIHGQLFLPPGMKPGERYPAVVFLHGGSRRQMLLGWNYSYYYHNWYALNQYVASRGYIVLSVNYRSGIGYGMEFREALNYGPNGASEFKDVMGAGLYLRSRPDVDGQKIGLWGGSWGGYLTALGLARASDLFAAGVDFHGVHDWNNENSDWVASDDPADNVNAARVAFESSPLSSMETWKSPVLVIQGDDDRNVPFKESVDLITALRRGHVEFENIVFPDEIHEFLLHRDWLRAFHAASDFMDKHLRQ